MAIKDNYHRPIKYLRISVTDRCNLRCVYCMPKDGIRKIEFKEILSYEEITRVVKRAAALGIKQIRLTGGEPLGRKDISYLVRSISAIPGIEEVSLTTNGVRLAEMARELKDAGLGRVNVSLDSLTPKKYSEITRGGDIETVLGGIKAAEDAGMTPVKINMVPIRGLNDGEIPGFAELTKKLPVHVRFIEFMPMAAGDFWSAEKLVPIAEIKAAIEKNEKLEPVDRGMAKGAGPARHYRIPGAQGLIGFISPVSQHFCKSCNRLRMTSDGKLRPCLFSDTAIDLKPALRGGADGDGRGGGTDDELERLIRLAISAKPEGHNLPPGGLGRPFRKDAQSGGNFEMSKIGG